MHAILPLVALTTTCLSLSHTRYTYVTMMVNEFTYNENGNNTFTCQELTYDGVINYYGMDVSHRHSTFKQIIYFYKTFMSKRRAMPC